MIPIMKHSDAFCICYCRQIILFPKVGIERKINKRISNWDPRACGDVLIQLVESLSTVAWLPVNSKSGRVKYIVLKVDKDWGLIIYHESSEYNSQLDNSCMSGGQSKVRSI